ncbi:MAG: hypothetical protein U1E94_02780 [Agitococcus sp.]
MSDNDRKVYAIRNLCFWYDDEYYFPLISSDLESGSICAFCVDKQAAIEEWKLLEYEFSHKMDFSNVIGFEECCSYLEDLGIELNRDFYEKLKFMDKDELFDLIQKLDRHVFFMYEYPADLKSKTLFNLIENRFELWDVSTDHLSNNFLKTNDEVTFITMNGTLEELSDAPLLLLQLIQNNPNIKYDEDSKTLEIAPDEQSLNSVNALLKNPLYEIRYLTIQEIYEIEQTLNPPNN